MQQIKELKSMKYKEKKKKNFYIHIVIVMAVFVIVLGTNLILWGRDFIIGHAGSVSSCGDGICDIGEFCALDCERLLTKNATAHASKTLDDQRKPSNAIDGDIVTPWNAGDIAPQWIELDLGEAYSINKIRLLNNQVNSGTIHSIVYAGTQPNPTEQLTILEDYYQNGTNKWWEYNVSSPKKARYIRILTDKSPNWIGWREIEIYGGKCRDCSYVPPEPQIVEYWVTPNMNDANDDYTQFFTNSSTWSDTMSKTSVFNFYAGIFIKSPSKMFFTDDQVQQLVQFLQDHHIAMSLEMEAVAPIGTHPCTGADRFAQLKPKLDRISHAGGNVTYIAMDEPLAYGTKRQWGCHLTMNQTFTETLAFIHLVHQYYPRIIVGDVEPPYDAKDLTLWMDLFYEQGEPLPFLQLDIPYNNTPSYLANLQAITTAARKHGAKVGVIVISDEQGYDPGVQCPVDYIPKDLADMGISGGIWKTCVQAITTTPHKGTWCGFKRSGDSHAAVLCDGLDPQQSCPQDFVSKNFATMPASLGGNWYTCAQGVHPNRAHYEQSSQPGVLCGLRIQENPNPVQVCGGYDPSVTCPEGYARTILGNMQGHGGNWYTCARVARTDSKTDPIIPFPPGEWCGLRMMAQSGPQFSCYWPQSEDDFRFFTNAEKFYQQYKHSVGQPDQVIIQSWYSTPHLTYPETEPYTFMYLAQDIMQLDNKEITVPT